ncbi:MAG: hypothetical protein IJ831_02285 [Spirochaetales bacterium]|nr:hypothetical protein [Spirochaetales bacterium]
MKYAFVILNGEETLRPFADSIMIENESSYALEEDTTDLVLLFLDTSLQVTEAALALLSARDNSKLGYIAALSPSGKALREMEKLLYERCELALSYASKCNNARRIRKDIVNEEIRLPQDNIFTRLLER